MPKRTGRTAKKESKSRPDPRLIFLEVLAETGIVTHAAIKAGIGRATAYEWYNADEAFARLWDEAVEISIGALELEARNRATKGVSDTLLIFLLKANRPEKYREAKAEVHIHNEAPADPAAAKAALAAAKGAANQAKPPPEA